MCLRGVLRGFGLKVGRTLADGTNFLADKAAVAAAR
jgi:hypothetical protein